MKVSEIKGFEKVQITTKRNVLASKLSVGVVGEEKTGKTHFWCTFPKPIVCFYTDPNTQTADGFIEECAQDQITLIKPPSLSEKGGAPLDDWLFYTDRFIPTVKNRLLDAKTIVIDSYSFLSHRLVLSKSGLDGTVTIPQWGQIASAHMDRLRQFVSSTQPWEDPAAGKPSYNIVVTCHLGDVTNDKGSLIKTRPAIMGSFKDEFGKHFGTVLIAKAQIKQEIKEGKLVTSKAEHIVHSVPPTQYLSCGDGYGGKAGRKELEPTLENTYSALCRGWGIEEEADADS